jgi:hypothetical protein
MAFPSSNSTKRIPNVLFVLLRLWQDGLNVISPRPGESVRKAEWIPSSLQTDAFTVNLNINALKEAFPWGNLKGTVVDVGGGSGKVSITLAEVCLPIL